MTRMETHQTTRRTFLVVTGGAVSAIGLAGCLGDEDEPNGGGKNDDAPDEFEIDPGTDIVLEGYASHWEGVEPNAIEGVENPTLALIDDEEYVMKWLNGDGVAHDLQIWDANDERVDDLTTDRIEDEGESASLTFTARPEMVTYICSLHQFQQIGDLVVQ